MEFQTIKPLPTKAPTPKPLTPEQQAKVDARKAELQEQARPALEKLAAQFAKPERHPREKKQVDAFDPFAPRAVPQEVEFKSGDFNMRSGGGKAKKPTGKKKGA